MRKEITVTKSEDIQVREFDFDTIKFMRGTKFAIVSGGYRGNKRYWDVFYYDTTFRNAEVACEFASHCGTPSGTTAKVRSFLMK